MLTDVGQCHRVPWRDGAADQRLSLSMVLTIFHKHHFEVLKNGLQLKVLDFGGGYEFY